MPPVSAPLRDAPPAAASAAGASLALAALILPPLGVLAPVGVAPLLALLALALLATDGRRSVAAVRPHAAVFALLAALSAWGAVTALWSPIPFHSLLESGRFLVIGAAGLVVIGRAALLSEAEARRLDHALLAGIAIATLLLQVELHSDSAVARLIHRIPLEQPIATGRYDRSITVLLLMAWPAAALLAARRRWLGLVVLALAVGATVGAFNSRASILALVVALPASALAARLPRLTALGMVGTVLLVAFVLPLAAPDGAGIERLRRAAPMLPQSAIHRLEIWRFAADRIDERPLLGWGMDASRAVPGGKTPVVDRFPEVTMNPLAEALPLHPHDAALQWRLELGLPGTLLAIAALGLVLWRLARSRALDVWRRALAFGYAASALTVALLSFGAWQAWWLSLLWLGAALLTRLGDGRHVAAA